MAFTTEQIKELTAKLDGNRVSKRQQGGMQLSYLEGYDVMDRANAIFGFDAWDYKVIRLTTISEFEGEKYGKPQYKIGKEAIVEVKVIAGGDVITRRDVGYGSGISKDLFDCHEGAGKEAVTDGLKRAMRGFGNQFGNALYDKQQTNVDYNAEMTPSGDMARQAEQTFGGTASIKIDYKQEIMNKMLQLKVAEADIPACAKAIIESGLDITNDPRKVWTEQQLSLIGAIKKFTGAAA